MCLRMTRVQLSPWCSVGWRELSNIECGEELLEILSGCEDSFLLGMLTRQQVKALLGGGKDGEA